MNTKGIWSSIAIKNEVEHEELPEGEPDKNEPIVYLWTRNTDGVRQRLKIKGFRHYLYCIPAVAVEAPYLLKSPEIKNIELINFPEGKKLYKVSTYVAGQTRKIMRNIQSSFAQAAVREGDVAPELRWLIDQKIRGNIDWYDISNPIPLEEDIHVPLRKMYIDIELWCDKAVKEGKMKKNQYIKCLTAYDSYEKIYYTWYYNEFDLKVKDQEGWKCIYCRTVDEMMKQFMLYVRDCDPDIITGYNVDFDLLCIRQELLRRNLREYFNYFSGLHDLGYQVRNPIAKRMRIRGKDWKRKGLVLDGREVVDMLDCVRMLSPSQLRSYTLDYVAKTYLGEDEGKLTTTDGKAIAQNIQSIWNDNPEVVLKYNMIDVELLVRIDNKNTIIDFLDMLRKTVGVRINDTFSNQRMVDTEALRRRTFPLPSKFSRKENSKDSYKGGFVVEPTGGLHEWVICYDYTSLYPTIIRTFNIDTDTYLPSETLARGRPFYKFQNEDGTKTWCYLKEPRGLFPRMLDDFINLRKSIKAELKKEKDPVKKQNLQIRQEVVKVIANSMYGSFAFRSRKHNLEVAESVTQFGQRIIKFAGSIAENNGFKVVYGDTDSIFIKANAKNYGEAYNDGVALRDMIMKEIPIYLKQFGVQERSIFVLNLEAVFDRLFLMTGKEGKATKKRYCGRIINADGTTKLKVTGLDTKRSDTSLYAGEFQSFLLTTLLEGKSKGQLKDIILKKINELDTLPLTSIGVPSAVTKNFNEYKVNAIQKKAALNSNELLGTNYDYGSKPLRFYTKIPDVKVLFPRKSNTWTEDEMKSQVEEAKKYDVFSWDEGVKLPDWFQVDYPKMLTLTIKPKLRAFLEAFEIDWKELKEGIKPTLLPVKNIKKTKKKKKTPSVTLDMFNGGKNKK